jgi:hypothetical protein
MSEIEKVGNEKLEDLFGEKFEEQIASPNSLSSYEVKCERNVVEGNKPDILIRVNVTGMAGDPVLSDWLTGKVENSNTIKIDTGRNILGFAMDKNECSNLSLVDYIIAYRFIKQL